MFKLSAPTRDQSVVAIIKIQNTGKQYTYLNWGEYVPSPDMYCGNDAGTAGQNCKTQLYSGDLQTVISTNYYAYSTFTYGINNIAYNVKIGAQATGLLDNNGNMVKTVGACTATNTYFSDYTLVGINCDKPPVPDYVATNYTTGVSKRGGNLSGQEWQGVTYYPSLNDCHTIKSIGMNSARFPIDITKLSGSNGVINWNNGAAQLVDNSLTMLLTCGLNEVILDAHNTLSATTSDWSTGVVTGEQLLSFWQQAVPRYQKYPNFAIGVVNEPHDLSADPTNEQLEAETLTGIYLPIVQWFSKQNVTNSIYLEPSNWGGIASYADRPYQEMILNLTSASQYPGTLIADGHAYGTNIGSPGGSGYGDCEADGVAHNKLEAVKDFLVDKGLKGAITEFNGDPSYPNCILFVNTTTTFMNQYPEAFVSKYLWAYYINEGSDSPLDINKYGAPASDPQILAMQSYRDLIPASLLTLSPTRTPTYRPSVFPTSAFPSVTPSFRPTAMPTNSTSTHANTAGLSATMIGVIAGGSTGALIVLVVLGLYAYNKYSRGEHLLSTSGFLGRRSRATSEAEEPLVNQSNVVTNPMQH